MVAAVKVAREKTCAITVLDINNCRLSPLNLAALARAMGCNQSLKVLKMENCAIDMNRMELDG